MDRIETPIDHGRMRRTAGRLSVVLVLILVAAACNGSADTSTMPIVGSSVPAASGSASTPTPTSPVPTTTPSPSAAADTVWLCRPGLAGNPCASGLSATVVNANGTTSVQQLTPATDPPIDCFYVYPTVSRQKGTNASLTIDPEERAVAVAQAAQFSQVCNVYAPMYPQLTLAAIAKPASIGITSALTAYQGVWSAFRDYMANYNHGRGIVFIGHSQGAFMLTALLRTEVDGVPQVRRLLVSALLIGGNVTVPIGKTVGGDFTNIPACASTTATGCVLAYSSYDTTPPSNALFGRTDSSLNPFGTDTSGTLQVLCVNPAAPAGGSAALAPYFPSQSIAALLGQNASTAVAASKTPFVTYPGEFSAQCKTAGLATWLQISRLTGSSDRRPGLANVGNVRWGLHVIDVNIALGNLVELVRSEAAGYRG